MFTLFKRRDFGDYVSDTFQFFRQTGKHYFKNYFIISGFMLIFLVAVSYFLFKVYFDFFSKIGLKGGDSDILKSSAFENMPLVILGAILMFLFMVLLHMLHFSIPVIYMDLYDKNNGDHFDFKEIVAIFKARFGKILIYFLGLIFIITPLLVLSFGSLLYLSVKTIGIPLTVVFFIPIFLFAIPSVYCWITLGFFEYLNNGKGFFEALAHGFRHVKNQYFPIICSSMIIYIIISIAMTVFTMIPYIIGMISLFSSTVSGADESRFSAIGTLMTMVMVVSMLTSFILNNLLLVNQGLVYYSRKEYDENVSSNDSIELIGSE